MPGEEKHHGPHNCICPNPACPARGQRVRAMSTSIRAKRSGSSAPSAARRSATKGTALYRLRTSSEMVNCGHVARPWLSAAGHRRGFGFDERTVASRGPGRVSKARPSKNIWSNNRATWDRYKPMNWCQDSGRHRVDGAGMMVRTRLWLAGEVSVHSRYGLIRGLIGRVRRCAAASADLVLYRWVELLRPGNSCDVSRSGATGGLGRPGCVRGATSASHRS